MATSIKQILDWPVGQRTGGFELFIKTIKKKWQVNGSWYQRVMFTDGPDEILGEIDLGPRNITIFRNMPIKIVIGERVTRDVNNKDVPAIFVSQWRDDRPHISEPEELDEIEKWREQREDEIKGKIRHGISCSFIKNSIEVNLEPLPDLKEVINKWVDFIMTGE